MAKNAYKVGNWSQYNYALVQRGSLSVWFSEDAAQNWFYDGPPQWGTDPLYSDFPIETILRLRLVYDLPLRQTQGFVESIFRLMDVDLPLPDYSTLSRRASDLCIDLCASSRDDAEDEVPRDEVPRDEVPRDEVPRHIVIDSTGLKVYGEGEWKQRQHGKSKRRTWRKIHISMDPETGEITAERLTGNDKHDCSQVEPLLRETVETTGRVSHVGGDGAYDTWDVYDVIASAGAEAVIPPQKNAKIKRHGNCSRPPLARDEAIRYIRRHGRAKWKRVHGYHLRSLAETALYRFKQIIGRVLRSRKRANQRTEARLGCQILNQMTRLGMPESYAVAVN